MLVVVNQDPLEEFVALVSAFLEIWCGWELLATGDYGNGRVRR